MQTMHGLLTALQGLHARGIAHGTVTADSLYVNATKTEDGQRMYDVKLINFASAVQFAAGAHGSSKFACCWTLSSSISSECAQLLPQMSVCWMASCWTSARTLTPLHQRYTVHYALPCLLQRQSVETVGTLHVHDNVGAHRNVGTDPIPKGCRHRLPNLRRRCRHVERWRAAVHNRGKAAALYIC
jgi:hypothetical protein